MRFQSSRSSAGLQARFRLMAYTGMTLSIVALVLVAALSVELSSALAARRSSTTTFGPASVTGPLITPPLSLAGAPPILADQPFGNRLTGINAPLNSTQLGMINGEPTSYYVTAAQMWLNGSLSTVVGQQLAYAPLLTVNGKPAVIYLGAISCVYCGENRWAMALALSQFGSFQHLFFGYSALGDQDVPTLYWAPAHYNSSSAAEFGNFYNGTYVTFLSIEYSSPIGGGFQMQSIPYFLDQAAATGNTAYEKAVGLISSMNDFAGTPYTIWGNHAVLGADSTDFGNFASTTSSSTSSTSGTVLLPLATMTHDQVLESLAHPSTQFAWTEYAAADYYIALVCSSLGVGSVSSASAPPICTLPAISSMTTVVARGAVNTT